MSNNYNTMEAVSEITWEDLQEIGINQLGKLVKINNTIIRVVNVMHQ